MCLPPSLKRKLWCFLWGIHLLWHCNCASKQW
jgi:hypothetical protein